MLAPVSDFPLLPFNTFGIASQAAWFDTIASEADILELKSQAAYKNGLLILGGGSNMLFTTNEIPMWVLRNEIRGIELLQEDKDHVWIKAGAGEVWHQFVLWCVDNGYGGVENMSLIPGTVGAAPIQNIGAYGAEVKDVIEQVRFYHLKEESFYEYMNAECKFGYRDSVFKHTLKGQFIISYVVFKLKKQPVFNTDYGQIKQELEAMQVAQPNLKAISDAVIRIRMAKLPDPKLIGNAGSFFKNPEIDTNRYTQLKNEYAHMPGYILSDQKVKIPAAWLIEHCGWKGYRESNFGVHQHQALVLVNYGGASGKQIAALSERIMQSVKLKFDIDLEREVQIV